MIGLIVPRLSAQTPAVVDSPPINPRALIHTMDPLSQILTLMKPQSYTSGGFVVRGDLAIRFERHQGIKCYAVLAGQCWLAVDDVTEPVLLKAGDCFLLPRGLPFRLATDLTLEPVTFTVALAQHDLLVGPDAAAEMAPDANYIVGSHFLFTGGHADMLLHALPPIVHIRSEADRATMRWSLERLREELKNPQPGGSLIAQQLACVMLVQALRLHLHDATRNGPGWLAALADKHISVAIASMHSEPGRPWTLALLAERVGLSRSVLALRFREVVGTTPMEYLTRWRMLLAADRLKNSTEGLSTIAQSLGYDSESAFGKAFRRVMGSSPRQYARTA